MTHQSNHVSLRLAIPAAIVVLSAFICLILGTVGYYQARSSLSNSLNDKLQYVVESEKQSIDKVIKNSASTIQNITTNQLTYKAINLQHQMLVSRPEETRAYFQPDDMAPEARVDLMGDTTNTYTYAHGEVHSIFLPYWRDLGASDILIVNAEGLVTYSVAKGEEFLREVTGDGMGELQAVYEQAMGAQVPATFTTSFARYDLTGEHSMFLAQPVFTRSSEQESAPIGVVIVRIAAAKISNLLDLSNAIESGVIFFFTDSDGRVIADGAGDRAGDPATVASEFLSDGTTSDRMVLDGPGQVISATSSLPIDGKPYYLIGVRAQSAAFAGVTALRNWMIGLSGLVALVFCGIGIGFSHLITRPIVQLTREMKELADGNTEATNEYRYASQEIAEMIGAVQVFRENTIRMETLTHEKEEADRRNAEAQAEDDAGSSRLRRRSGPGRGGRTLYRTRRCPFRERRAERDRRRDQQPSQ